MNNEHEPTESAEVPPDPSVCELRKGTAQIQESDERGLDQTTRQKVAQALWQRHPPLALAPTSS